MAQYGVSFVATVYAWDTNAGSFKTGDAANILLYWTKDGTQTLVASNSGVPTEVSSSQSPGQYKITMGATEAQCIAGTLGGKSSTANIIIIPAQFTFDTGDFTATQKTSITTAATAATPTAAAVTAPVSVTGDLSATMKASVTTAALATQMTESYAADGVAPTLAQLLFLLLAAQTEFAVSGTTMTAKKLDGSTSAATFTLDSATAPTSITRAS